MSNIEYIIYPDYDFSEKHHLQVKIIPCTAGKKSYFLEIL